MAKTAATRRQPKAHVPRRRTRGVQDGGRTGLGVDDTGGPVIDPTENVIALVLAETKRQDDLRAAEGRRVSESIGHVESTAALRAEHNRTITEITAHLADCQTTCAKQIADIRVEYAAALSEKESKRLDAIRQIDVLAGSTATSTQLTAIQTLAAATTAMAENLRATMTTTAQTVAAQLQAIVTRLEERIGGLEKSSYTGAGRETYTDPAFRDLAQAVKALNEARAGGAGKTEGISTVGAIVMAIVVGIGVMATVGAFLFMSLHK